MYISGACTECIFSHFPMYREIQAYVMGVMSHVEMYM